MPVDEILKELGAIKNRALRSIAMVRGIKGLESARVRYLGKKGQLTSLMRVVGGLPPDARPLAGQTANSVKGAILQAIAEKETELKAAEQESRIVEERVDITMPGADYQIGRKHPLTLVTEEILRVFCSMGFGVAEGPDIESDYNNFEALNIPKHHPARDLHDTFYVSKDVVLRTHTSPVQIRTMLATPPPVAVVCPGRVYRCDADATHSPMFHQVEGLMVDKAISFSDLKGILEVFVHEMFGPDTPFRFRPHYFPFTEPSCELDILFHGEGEPNGEGVWLEVLGAGMVHPAVFENVGYDPQKVSGFAFGLGVERLAMIKYGISDIRLFFENDLRFLQQF
ncbi:MAG: phenylalanine--tRNA ligase subunit alpha [Candidatus Sumerlaeota bacterium]|nr:phenylalanine--tRNA ligase subunit alpha [Candidatus Sumerlaeota bacterium]